MCANFITIPNLPAATALNGSELLELVQAGVSVRGTTAQIATLAANQAGGVYNVGLFVSAATFQPPPTTSVLQTSGFSMLGIGGALYKRANSLPPFNAGFLDAFGDAWQIVPDNGLFITQFGALPDSNRTTYTGTDNAPSINNAIAYVNSLPGGGTINVPTGVFGVFLQAGILPGSNAAIGLLSGVTMQGLGGWIVRLTQTNSLAPPYHLISIADQDRVAIIGMNIDGNRAGQVLQTSGHSIRSHNSSNVTVFGNFLYNSQGYTISSDIDIDAIDVSFNHIFNSSADAIDFHNTGIENNVALVEGNIINGFGFNGVPKAAIHGRGQGFICINNSIRNCGPIINGIAGIAIGNGESITGQKCIGNYVEMGTNCTLAKGIVINNPNAIVLGNVIAGDTGTFSGITVNGTGTTVTANVVTVASGKTVSVAGNGYNMAATADHCVIANNMSYGCGQDGFNDAGTNNKYSNNEATNCAGYGYDMLSSTGSLLDSLNTQLNCSSGLLRRGTGTLFDQATDISSTPSFAFVRLTNPPSGGTDAVNKAYADALVSGSSLFVAGQSGVATAVMTGVVPATETVLATKTIPGGLMGLNGMLTVYYSGLNNSGAASKIYRVRLGGLTGSVFSAFSTTTNTTVHGCIQLINAGSASVQKGQVSNSVNFGPSTSTPLTGTVNTAIDQDLVLTAQITGGTNADTMFYDWYSMQFSRGPT